LLLLVCHVSLWADTLERTPRSGRPPLNGWLALVLPLSRCPDPRCRRLPFASRVYARMAGCVVCESAVRYGTNTVTVCRCKTVVGTPSARSIWFDLDPASPLVAHLVARRRVGCCGACVMVAVCVRCVCHWVCAVWVCLCLSPRVWRRVLGVVLLPPTGWMVCWCPCNSGSSVRKTTARMLVGGQLWDLLYGGPCVRTPVATLVHGARCQSWSPTIGPRAARGWSTAIRTLVVFDGLHCTHDHDAHYVFGW